MIRNEHEDHAAETGAAQEATVETVVAPHTRPGSHDPLAELRGRYPDASEGILFCVHKLLQNPDLRIPDFRQEAALYGISLGGRALHSAKVLLGLEKPAVRKQRRAEPIEETPRAETRTAPRAERRRRSGDPASTAATAIDAIRQLEAAASADHEHLRTAMREALEILRAALDED